MAKVNNFRKIIVGRADLVFFVGVSEHGIPAKVDTGAYRSAVHAENIREKNGTLYFDLLANHPVVKDQSFPVKRKSYRKVVVENSFGHQEERFEVKMRVKIGPRVFTAPFTLANRSVKIYPILLGRNLLNKRFLVDTSETAINKKELKKAFGGTIPKDEEEVHEHSDSI